MQAVIALSSCEAELIALTTAVKEGIWLTGLFQDLIGLEQMKWKIQCDNKSTVSIAETGSNCRSVRHIRLRRHLISELVNQKKLSIVWIDSSEQLADLLTKVLEPHGHHRLAKLIGTNRHQHQIRINEHFLEIKQTFSIIYQHQQWQADIIARVNNSVWY